MRQWLVNEHAVSAGERLDVALVAHEEERTKPELVEPSRDRGECPAGARGGAGAEGDEHRSVSFGEEGIDGWVRRLGARAGPR